jgi:hypothetical protein
LIAGITVGRPAVTAPELFVAFISALKPDSFNPLVLGSSLRKAKVLFGESLPLDGGSFITAITNTTEER